MRVLLMLFAALAAGACRPAPETRESAVPTPGPPGIRGQLVPAMVADMKRVPETFRTAPLTEGKDVDSLAFWPHPGGVPWLLVTQKDLSYILVLNATTGELLERVGGMGDEPGKFNRPNGIAVTGDLVLVVERDARRVQVLRLPDFEPLGTFGEDLLKFPYGVAVDQPGEWYEVYVTDSFDSPDDALAPPEATANRVRHYRFRLTESALEAELVRSFGEASGEGALHRVESMAIDRPLGRLYLADESTLRLNLKAYTLEGRFLQTFGDDRQYFEPEGVVVPSCGPEEEHGGYVVVADQTPPTRFLVYERGSLDYLGGFTGEPTIENTDGTAFAVVDNGSGEREAMFFATHHDVQVVAYRWGDIAGVMGLQTDCR